VTESAGQPDPQDESFRRPVGNLTEIPLTLGLGPQRTRWKVFVEAVGLSVAGAALTVAVVATVTAVGRRVPASAAVADVILRYARNPLTWLVIYGTLVGGPALFRRWRPEFAADA